MPPARFVAVAFVAALAVTACSGGGGGDKDTGAKDGGGETSSEEFTHATVRLGVSKAELVSPHKPLGPLEQPTVEAAVGLLEKLLLRTSARPLMEGTVGEDVADLFTPDAGARAAKQDRTVLFDEGLPSFGPIKPAAARVRLTGLAETLDPSTVLVIAKFVWDVASTDHPGDRVTRNGELSLIKVNGGWKIGAYTISVTRTIDDATTTTTAKSK